MCTWSVAAREHNPHPLEEEFCILWLKAIVWLHTSTEISSFVCRSSLSVAKAFFNLMLWDTDRFLKHLHFLESKWGYEIPKMFKIWDDPTYWDAVLPWFIHFFQSDTNGQNDSDQRLAASKFGHVIMRKYSLRMTQKRWWMSVVRKPQSFHFLNYINRCNQMNITARDRLFGHNIITTDRWCELHWLSFSLLSVGGIYQGASWCCLRKHWSWTMEQ